MDVLFVCLHVALLYIIVGLFTKPTEESFDAFIQRECKKRKSPLQEWLVQYWNTSDMKVEFEDYGWYRTAVLYHGTDVVKYTGRFDAWVNDGYQVTTNE